MSHTFENTLVCGDPPRNTDLSWMNGNGLPYTIQPCYPPDIYGPPIIPFMYPAPIDHELMEAIQRAQTNVNPPTVGTEFEEQMVFAQYSIPGYGKEDIKSLEYHLKTRCLKLTLHNGISEYKSSFCFTDKLIPETIKVQSFEKGILIISSSFEPLSKENRIIKII